MRQVGVHQAEAAFPALMSEVERTDEDLVVTRDGRAAVRIVSARPVDDLDRLATRRLIDSVNALREAAASESHGGVADMDDLLDRDRDDRWS